MKQKGQAQGRAFALIVANGANLLKQKINFKEGFMNKELTVKQTTEAIDYTSREVIDLLKQTVAKGTTDLELKLFVEQIKATGLNPFKKEIWCIVVPAKPANGSYRGRDREVQMMTGVNGFYQIANSDPTYDGLEHGLVGPTGEYLSLGYPKDDYIGAWTRVYIKGRRVPQEEVAFLSEYDKGYGNWKTMRRIMIIKCADSLALRKALPQKLNGLYTSEEMPSEYQAEVVKDVSFDSNGKPDNGTRQILDKGLLKTADELEQEDKPHDPDELLGFGKHRAQKWCEVNRQYLEWLVAQHQPRFSLRALAELERRDSFTEDPLPDYFEQQEGRAE